MTADEKSADSQQRVATLRPGQGGGTERSVFQKAEAQTVMFASPRALPLTDDVTGLATAYGGRQPVVRVHSVWLTRAILLLILLLQAALTLRMTNTAFEDEALYLYVGHLEIAHFLHDASLQGNYPSYFSGAPVLYPVLGAVADSIGGLRAARAVSLIEMLAATMLLYGITRRLFTARIGLCAAAIFSVSEPILFIGNLATYDASSLCLLALASWVVVRTAGSRWPYYLLAAPFAVLAVATKYAALLFVPCVIVLAGLAAWPKLGRKALLPPIALTAAIGALLGGVAHLAGSDYWQGITSTTLTRASNTVSGISLLWDSAQWIGLGFVLAVIGTVVYAVRPAREIADDLELAGSKSWRIALGIFMAGSALLAPAEQIRIHTFVSLQKHVGFGLFFAAPIAGVGLAWIIGDHLRRTQVAIAIWGALVALGMTQANNLFHVWSNSTVMVSDMSRYLQPGAHYLVEVDEVPIYYLRHHGDAQPDQFTSTYTFEFVNKQGTLLSGDAAYVAAIQQGYFRVVAFDYGTTPATDTVIARALATNPDYRLADVVPESNGGSEYIWAKDT